MKDFKLSINILTHNETKSLKKLLNYFHHIKKDSIIHEIVVLDDFSTNEKTIQILNSFQENNTIDIFKQRKLNKDFASQKNYADSLCSGTYIFNLDADEFPPRIFIETEFLKNLTKNNPEVDLYGVPRINTVNGLTDEHIQKWGWRVNENGWVNYPDFQFRFYKNANYIHWEGVVHERPLGSKKHAFITAIEKYSILHHKQIEKQEKQNEFYEKIQ